MMSNIANKILELLNERGIKGVLNNDKSDDWYIIYWANGADGPTEEIRKDTLVADLWWLI